MTALYLPQLKPRQGAIRWVLIGYTALTILLWIIAGERSGIAYLDKFIEILDRTLRRINSDYDAKRFKNIALNKPLVHVVKEGTFYHWMKKRDKLGGQNKVPRLANTREYLDDILLLIKEK